MADSSSDCSENERQLWERLLNKSPSRLSDTSSDDSFGKKRQMYLRIRSHTNVEKDLSKRRPRPGSSHHYDAPPDSSDFDSSLSESTHGTLEYVLAFEPKTKRQAAKIASKKIRMLFHTPKRRQRKRTAAIKAIEKMKKMK